MKLLVVLISLLMIDSLTADVHSHVTDFKYGQFADGFMWGAATAAYQIEGGWNADGKGVSIWDTRAHSYTPGLMFNNDTGDIACDSYHQYLADVNMLHEIGAKFYRFSISWTRILPNGTIDNINQNGIDYYNRLINALLSADIQPFVTLYHWDLPQDLQDKGGFYNESMADWFNNYAKLCFQKFGDRVKLWLTFNEPWVVSVMGYGYAQSAPGLNDSATGPYRATHNIIKSHVKAYRTYQREFKPKQQGKVGITLNVGWSEPKTDYTADKMAAEVSMQFQLGWFANPLLVNGDYPDVMKQKVKAKSVGKSRLPEFTATEIQNNKGAIDFLGINQYSATYISYQPSSSTEAGYYNDQDGLSSVNPKWPTTAEPWLKVVPWGMRRVLNWVREHYNNPIVYITENGRPQDFNQTDVINGVYRIEYLKAYINEVMKAIQYEGCNVKGYTVWSLMDNLEWFSRFFQKFGIYQVDFSDPRRHRTAKDSAKYYAKIIRENGFPDPSVVNSIG